MPSTDTKPELTAKALMAQPISQPAVYANGLTRGSMTSGEEKLWVTMSSSINYVSDF
jgi:hypothetical protein